MVRNNTSLKQAALDLGIHLDPDEAERTGRRKDFQEILRVEANKYRASIANDPTRTKSAVLGAMIILAEKLMHEGEHEKAGNLLEKICKIEGWTGVDTNVNIFAGLTMKDIQDAKARILASKQPPQLEN